MGSLNQSQAVQRSLLTPTAAAHATFVPTGIVTVLLGPLLPTLTSRWALNDTQAGDFFFMQFAGSTGGVALSGVLTPRLGYRMVLVLGLLFMAAGVATLLLGSWWLGMASVAAYGFGFGLTVPTSNLLVAEANPAGKAAALNLLNFTWSVGAVACPFLLAPFQRSQHTSVFLFVLAGGIVLVAATLAGVSLPSVRAESGESTVGARESLGRLMSTAPAIALAALFFVYVGTENAVGGWLATYAKRIASGAGTMWVTTPSFFYGGLLVGRAIAPALLRRVVPVKLARVSITVALLGVVGLLVTRSMAGVMCGASVIGLGLATVYPITISLLPQTFPKAAARLGSVMFALASIGGACVPWMVGFASTQRSSLQLGLLVPLAGCGVMLGLYCLSWAQRGSDGSVAA